MRRKVSKQTVDELSLLMGRPPVADFLGAAKAFCVDGECENQAKLMEDWRKANDYIKGLEESEGDWADGPILEPLGGNQVKAIKSILEHPSVRRAYCYLPAQIAMVDLDRLVIAQRHLNMTHAKSIESRLRRSKPSWKRLLELAFPLEDSHVPVQVMQISGNSFSFTSSSSDLRFIDCSILNPSQVQGHVLGGLPISMLGLSVGYGCNFISALHIENRLILNNGHHRAYALRASGVRWVPCLVQKVSRREELELIGNAELQKFPERHLGAPRPPLLKDFFEPTLCKTIRVLRRMRVVQVSFSVEQVEIPAA